MALITLIWSGGGGCDSLGFSYIHKVLRCSVMVGIISSPLYSKGASRYDVCIRGGRGSWKSGRGKGGCVNFIV